MAYIGRNPAIGTQKVLDSLESQFNGILTTFDLRYNGTPTYPTISSSLIVSLGGVLQEPGEAYYVSSDTIVFATAPPAGSDCWILLYSEYGAAAGSGSSGGAVSVATGEPLGFEERTDSAISFDNSARTFTIAPASGISEFVVWTKGTKRIYSTAQTVQIGTSTGLYYIYFDAFGVLQYRTTYFIWDEDTPTAYVYWNATTTTGVFVADERHGIVLDWQTHEYLHRTRGAVIANGFSISNYTTTGDGSADADAQFDLGNGTFFDEDLEVGITHSATPSAGTFTQVLTGNAEIPVYYMSGSEGDWVKDAATEFACKQSGTTLQYNLLSGNAWSTTVANNNRYVVSWVVATNEINAPVIAILGQDQYSSIGTAEEAVWGDLTLTNFPIFEFRPLWKIIFRANSGYTNTPNAYIANVLDLREFSSTGIAGTIVNDHGLLSGLADDDHAQYLNTTVDRTGVTANISTTGNITATNLIATGQLQGPVNFVIDPAAIGDDTGTVEIKGNLTVQGTTTTINSTTMTVDDKNLELGTGAANDAAADGGGITIVSGDGNKTFNFESTGDNLGSSENLNLASGKEYKINNTSVLSATTLGSGVTGSSLTSVGTLGALTVSGDVSIADKIIHTGDTNAALRFPAADTFSVETAGSERLRITSAGLVTVGPQGSVGITLDPNGNLTTEGRVYSKSVDTTVSPLLSQAAQGSSRADWAVASQISRSASGSNAPMTAYWNISSDSTNNYSKTALALSLKNQYNSGAVDLNQFKFRSNGTFSATGNIGIGTDDPSTELDIYSSTFSDITISSARTTGNIGGINFKKDVTGTPASMAQVYATTEGHIQFKTGGVAASNDSFRINANGNVGIGTDNPAAELEVYGDGRFKSTDGSHGIELYSDVVGGGYQRIISYNRTSSAYEDLSIGVNDFIVTNGASTERLRVTSDGNVGIGTGDPQSTLHVKGAIQLDGTSTAFNGNFSRIYQNSSSSVDYGLQLRHYQGNTSDVDASITIGGGGSTRENNITFYRSNGSGGSNESMRIDENGNVGIGTATPAYKLEVEGDIKVGELGTLWFSDASGSVEKIVGTGGNLEIYADADVHFFESDNNVRKFTVDVNDGQLDLGSDLDTTTAQVHFDYHATSYINGSLFGLGTTSPAANLQVEYGTGTNASTTIRIGTANDLNIDRVYSLGWGDPSVTNMGIGPYSTARSVFGSRHGLGIHVNPNDEFSVRSSGWDKLFGIEGGTGNGYFKGNVGIGTADPQEKLHVEGNMRLNGSVIGGVLTAVVADDSYVDVTPSILGGLFVITPFSTYPDYSQPVGSGMMYYDVGNSRLLATVVDTEVQRTGSTAKLISGGTSTSTTATDFTDDATTVTTPSGGTLRIFNRHGSARQFKLVFL